ncbi:MAG: TrmH family RNA methyltransferase [Cytophagales bacterium]|nr:TrmH family RNA methyltransferase [Cytophagales bacterium]
MVLFWRVWMFINFHFKEGGLIVIGNESNGISKTVEKLVTQKITIPRYGDAESLNAAIATGVMHNRVIIKNELTSLSGFFRKSSWHFLSLKYRSMK